MNNLDKHEQAIPTADNSVLFGTTSSDIVEGLHHHAFPQSESAIPGDEDQIVNEEDQQDVVNPTTEETATPPSQESTTLQNLPGIEKDLLDKNILEENEVAGDKESNDVKAS